MRTRCSSTCTVLSIRCPTDLDYSNSNQNRRKPSTQNCTAERKEAFALQRAAYGQHQQPSGSQQQLRLPSKLYHIDRATVTKEPSSRVDDHWTPTRAGAAVAIENWGSISSSFARARNLCSLIFMRKGFSTLLRELKWLFVWSLQTLFAAVHSVFTVSSKVLQLYLYCSL